MNALKEGEHTGGSARDMLSIIKEEAALAEAMTGFRWEISTESHEFKVSSRRDLPIRRFLSEALMNAWKHSGENNGTVTLALMGNRVVLTVADKGRGFDYANAVDSITTGLKSLNHRAKELGADLSIETGPGQGCKLVLTLPVSP
jgi:signal transduction histidine kinase